MNHVKDWTTKQKNKCSLFGLSATELCEIGLAIMLKWKIWCIILIFFLNASRVPAAQFSVSGMLVMLLCGPLEPLSESPLTWSLLSTWLLQTAIITSFYGQWRLLKKGQSTGLVAWHSIHENHNNLLIDNGGYSLMILRQLTTKASIASVGESGMFCSAECIFLHSHRS